MRNVVLSHAPDGSKIIRNRLTIGFLTRGVSGSPMWAGVADVARERDVNLMIVAGGILDSPHGFEAQSNVLYDLAQTAGFDGFVVASGILGHYGGVETMQAFCARYRDVPVVSVEVPLPGIPSVLLDFYHGMRAILEHLIVAHGYRRIAFIRGPAESKTGEDRYRAYRDALAAHDLPCDPNLVAAGTFFAPSGVEAVRLLLDERQVKCEALAAANDYMALDAMRALQARGVRVPEDMAVVGFDDREESRVVTPPLTTAQLRQYEQGRQGAEVLCALLEGQPAPEQVVLPATLVVRQSCGCTAVNIASVSKVASKFAAELSAAYPAAPPGNVAGIALTPFKERMQQALIVMADSAERAQAWQRMQAERQFLAVRELGQSLITTFDIPNLMDILARELPRIGIPGCYLSLYEAGFGAAASLMLAYRADGRVTVPADGQHFPAGQLVPPGVLPDFQRQTLILEALYFREEQLGFVLFEVGPDDIVTRMTQMVEASSENPLRVEISSALQGALLVERVQAHAAEVARQKYILDTFMANVPDAIYFKDHESRIMQANQAHAARFGLGDPTAEIGKTDFDFFPRDLAQRRCEQEQAILRTGIPLVNEEENDNQGRWVLTTKMPLRDEHGAIIGTFGISRDITALKQAEQELRQYRDQLEHLVAQRTAELSRSNARLHEEILERQRVETDLTRSNTYLHEEILKRERIEHALRVSEEQYRIMAENVRDGIVIVQQGKIVLLNRGFAAMTGYAPEQTLLTDLMGLLQPSDRPTMLAWLAADQPGAPATPCQIAILTRAGPARWVEIDQIAIEWQLQPAHLLSIRDITLRKRREQQLEEERARLQQENVTLKSTIKERYRFGELVGKSAAMQQVYERILSAATADANVLICGESGTGKELIARTLHQVSVRKAQPFVPVNCASIPETLFEREFFGHRKGAFTGADRDAPGFFDRAHRGVLFLDEVTELTPGTQAKLLRVLQDGEYFPVGSPTPKQADALIVAATNTPWQAELDQGRLRKDFFYRICVIAIDAPPLRARKDDLPLLIETILRQYHERQAKLYGQTPPDLPTDQSMLPAELVQALYAYDWPGNVRELYNVLHRYLATQDLNAVLPVLGVSGHAPARSRTAPVSGELSLPDAVRAHEKQVIADALAHTGRHIGKTCELLRIPRRTLSRKIKEYQL